MSDLTPQEQALLQKGGEIALRARRKCLEDPLYLGHHILGYNYENPPHFLRWFRDRIKNYDDFLGLVARGHSKTTTCNVVGSVWQILDDAEVRILMLHGVLGNAQKILSEATNHFRNNPKLRRLFPEHAPQGRAEDPTTTRFTTPARQGNYKEPTISAGAPGSTETGMHYDVIQATDLVNEQNVPAPIGRGSPETMAQVNEFIKTLRPLLDTTDFRARPQSHKACRQFNGTRWHDGDAYGYILDKMDYMQSLVVELEMDDEGNPIPIWDLIDKQTLIEACIDSGPILWAANYLNRPLYGDDAMGFKLEWFHDWDLTGKERVEFLKTCKVAITVDPAISEKEAADRTAIVVSAIAPDGNFYVLHSWAGRVGPAETIDRLLDLDSVYNPDWVGIESVAYQKALKLWAEDVARRKGRRVPFRELKADGSKIRRASTMQLHAQKFGIYLKHAEHADLLAECMKFPVGQHDDLVDAMCYRGQDLFLPAVRTRQPKVVQKAITPEDYAQTGEEVIKRIQRTSERKARVRLGAWR